MILIESMPFFREFLVAGGKTMTSEGFNDVRTCMVMDSKVQIGKVSTNKAANMWVCMCACVCVVVVGGGGGVGMLVVDTQPHMSTCG